MTNDYWFEISEICGAGILLAPLDNKTNTALAK